MDVVVTLNNRSLWAGYYKTLLNFRLAFLALPKEVQKEMLANNVDIGGDLNYLEKELSIFNKKWDELDPLSIVKIGGYYKELYGNEIYNNGNVTTYYHLIGIEDGEAVVENIRLSKDYITSITEDKAVIHSQLLRNAKGFAVMVLDGKYVETTEDEWNKAMSINKQLKETYDNSR